jgi:hypothetical protein
VWDPATGIFSVAGNAPSHNIFCAGHAWLPDGRLLVVGGQTPTGAYNGENRADIYNPFTNLWANADPLQTNVPNMGSTSTNTGSTGKRWYPSATSLSNGDVLVTSGDVTEQGVTNRTVQIYRTATNSWSTLTGALRPTNDALPEYPRVFQAPDGRAISMSDNSNDTEFLNMSGNGSWSYLQDTLDSNLHNYGPAVMYDTGKIAYLGGGYIPTDNISMLDLNEQSPSWRYAGGGITAPADGSPYKMAQPRRQNNATILADGTLLITGGSSIGYDPENPNDQPFNFNDSAGQIALAEIWDPETEQVTPVAEASSVYRGYHSTAILLPDGRVIVAGGNHDQPKPDGQPGTDYIEQKSAEFYSPAYLFNEDGSPAVRPTVTAAPDVAELGDTIFVETPDAESITKALWVVPGAVTHAQNWTQRANTLDFTAVDGGVNIELPANENEAPVGYYMLFLVNDQGTPSMAEWIQATTNIMLPGDFNDDHVVNAADYTVWRNGLGSTYTEADYGVWKDHFGETDGTGAGSAGTISSLSVPEPAAFASLMIGLAAAAVGRRRRKRGWCR